MGIRIQSSRKLCSPVQLEVDGAVDLGVDFKRDSSGGYMGGDGSHPLPGREKIILQRI